MLNFIECLLKMNVNFVYLVKCIKFLHVRAVFYDESWLKQVHQKCYNWSGPELYPSNEFSSINLWITKMSIFIFCKRFNIYANQKFYFVP